MYAWLWRHLPFRRWQYKLATTLVLVVGVGALLWYVIFPWAEPLLPFDDVQVTQDSGDPGAPDVPIAPSESSDEFDIPYETEPSATPS
jgi:cytoskeletal protein RodZ